MNIELIPLRADQINQFKKEMQAAFQSGATEAFGDNEVEILPERDIDNSLNAEGTVAYEAISDGIRVGGAIVVIDSKTQHNHLDFLFVKVGVQSRGIGQAIWNSIEKLHSKTKVWETITPYFEKRNIHFYVNCCGFHIVEFFNKYHPDPNEPCQNKDENNGDYFEGMFRFEKIMK